MKIVVFTAAIGETHAVRAPIVVDPEAEYLCFSDRPPVAPYEWIRVPASDQPMLDARQIKILANHPRLRLADATLWHDASYMLTRNLDWLRKALATADAAAMRHARRSCIEDESMLIARYGYVTSDQAIAHVERYRAAGFADHVLTASGLLGRRVSPAVDRFNALWWGEAQQWAGRDQGSIDYAAWAAGVRIQHVKGTVRANKYAGWRTRRAPEVAVA